MSVVFQQIGNPEFNGVVDLINDAIHVDANGNQWPLTGAVCLEVCAIVKAYDNEIRMKEKMGNELIMFISFYPSPLAQVIIRSFMFARHFNQGINIALGKYVNKDIQTSFEYYGTGCNMKVVIPEC